ncbi:MAG: glycosyl transferase family 28 [Flavobacteriales bacterium]|nr:MAG: glycosyl transferase family 28 [Flavobacteriales bacterium]
MTKQKTILVCPLDWGLGHATRCIPLIRQFIIENSRVIIGSSGSQKVLLQQEFPNLTFIDLKGYEVKYPKSGSMALKMLLQLPKINKAIKSEHVWLAKIIDEHQIDLVVSDNRYGLWNKKVKSVLITHQIFVKAPIGEWMIEQILKRHFDNFDEIWIPDVEGENNLSGDLSHKKPLPNNYRFIGLLSRFSNASVTSSVSQNCGTYREVDHFEFDFIAILSGPEPQRSIFENIILKQVESSNLKGILVRGIPEDNSECKIQNAELKVFNHLETDEFLHYLQKSKVVISRSGYSTIMDLAALGKKGILVPTPGQTEQEYLAKYHSQKGRFFTQIQKDFSLEKAFNEVENY